MLTSVVEGVGNGPDRIQCVKCNKYWPDNIGDTKKYGDIQVQLFDRAEVSLQGVRKNGQCLKKHFHVQAPNYCVRKLDVTKLSEANVSDEDRSRVIVHLQLTDWPDRTAPGSTGHLVQLVQLTHVLLNTHNTGPQRGPLLVHCSAGVGRTGEVIENHVFYIYISGGHSKIESYAIYSLFQ